MKRINASVNDFDFKSFTKKAGCNEVKFTVGALDEVMGVEASVYIHPDLEEALNDVKRYVFNECHLHKDANYRYSIDKIENKESGVVVTVSGCPKSSKKGWKYVSMPLHLYVDVQNKLNDELAEYVINKKVAQAEIEYTYDE